VYPSSWRIVCKHFRKITNYWPWFGTWWQFIFVRVLASYGFDYYKEKIYNKEKRPKGLRE
jgi:hypothetical protein